MSGERLEVLIKIALGVYVVFCMARALLEQAEPVNKPGRTRAERHRGAMCDALHAFNPRLTAEQVEAIVNRRLQETKEPQL